MNTSGTAAEKNTRRRRLAFAGVLLVEGLIFIACMIVYGVAAIAILVFLQPVLSNDFVATAFTVAFMGMFFPVIGWSRGLAWKLTNRLLPKAMEGPKAEVDITHDAIVSRQPGAPAESVLWRDLQEVHIVNQDGWPIGTQYWLLIGVNGTGAIVPSDATGARDLLSGMQTRLQGFDNRTVIVAMGEVSGSHCVWRAAGEGTGAD